MPNPAGSSLIVVAIVGLAGSGKSEVARVFSKRGYARVRFGDITDSVLNKKGLPINEYNERAVREELRREHGMAAYAMLSIPSIESALRKSSVVADGMYSWEEYLLLREQYGKRFKVLAVWSSPEDRYARLAARKVRPLSNIEAMSRDHAEIENLNKGGPIAMAEITIINDCNLTDLEERSLKAIKTFEGR